MDFLHLSSFSLSTIAILLTASYHARNEAARTQRENHALGDFSNIAYISDGKMANKRSIHRLMLHDCRCISTGCLPFESMISIFILDHFGSRKEIVVIERRGSSNYIWL